MIVKRLLIITLLSCVLNGCASTQKIEEGGIGGTGHSEECETDDVNCKK